MFNRALPQLVTIALLAAIVGCSTSVQVSQTNMPETTSSDAAPAVSPSAQPSSEPPAPRKSNPKGSLSTIRLSISYRKGTIARHWRLLARQFKRTPGWQRLIWDAASPIQGYASARQPCKTTTRPFS
ncbi:hypothetical protein J5X98_12780 [Leptothermofonsia sichuanensis E412]|uniref:hypothetical protein n=1 Tax=Leptothermofonsia sichuanensis TaxID=2917832 RepID=UPI001CA74E71|nr:hypothetical protein [Leptothermofonsia sichuanensis]QZZ23125.1 hypothetical protein J5X98_12780 [Leptothermofonsia sichuanensis E412]